MRGLDNVEAAALADTVVLVVKPQDMWDLLDEIADALRPGTLVVSLAAGITTRVPRVAAADRDARRPGHAEHARAASTRAWPRSSRGAHCDESHLAGPRSCCCPAAR